MGRLIIGDENVQQTITGLAKHKECVIGLIVGQFTIQKDLVCHLAAMPRDCNTPTAGQLASKKTSQSKKVTSSSKLDDIDEKWSVQHARQVIRMLPGGLTILGVFTMSSNEALPPDMFTKVKQILLSVYKFLNRQIQMPAETIETEKILLHICSANEKVTAKTIDISNPQNAAKPAEFRCQHGGVGWLRLNCQVALDLSMPINADQSTLPLLKQIHNGVASFCSALEDSVVTIDGRLRKLTGLLNETMKEKRGKNRDIPGSSHTVDVYIRDEPNSTQDFTVLPENCRLHMALRGTLQSRAYVHSRATVGEATHAVKQDIVRSLVARCEIHCEDLLLIDEEQQDPSVVHEPPRRVFAHLPGSDITVSDYLFPGEKARDSLNAYQELLSLDLAEEDIEYECERLADSTDLVKTTPSDKGCLIPTTADILSIPNASKSSWNVLVLLLSVAIATLAVSLSYLLLRAGNDEERE